MKEDAERDASSCTRLSGLRLVQLPGVTCSLSYRFRWIFKCQVDVDDWGLALSDVSRSGNPRVSPSLGLGINAFKCQTGAGGWKPVSPLLPEVTVHASAFYWALTFVRELKPTVLISEPLIIGIIVCL